MKTPPHNFKISILFLTAAFFSAGIKQADAELVGHWTFDDPTTEATLLDDVSTAGADNNGTQISGTAAAGVVGQMGGAMELFGNQNINLGSSADFDTTTWTASMWLWIDPGVGGWRTAFASWGGGPPNSIHVGQNSNGTWGDHGGGQTSGAAAIVAGQWYHIVSVRTASGSENSLWIDGVKQAQTTTGAPATPGASLVYIGTKNGAENHWDGRIDDLAYFNEELSPEQIGLIYNGGLLGQNVAQALNPGAQSSISLTISSAVSGYALEWDSQAGMSYNLRSSEDLLGAISTWTLVEGEILATPDTNTKNVTPSETTLFYAVEEYPTPPVTLLSEGFDIDDGLFKSMDKSGRAGSDWVHGDPDSMSLGGNVLTGNGGMGKCWGTDISNPGFYRADTDVCLRSPVINLTGVVSATLSFAQAIDIKDGHTLVVNIIDDNMDDVIVAAIHTSTPDSDISTTTWTTIKDIDISGAALGQEVRVEWRFTGNGDGEYIGAYIDDVLVTKPGF